MHLHSCRHKPTTQTFVGTCADTEVRKKKFAEAQKAKRQAHCIGGIIHNVAIFKYLGSLFSADGNQLRDVKRRVALAMNRCGALNQVFNSEQLETKLKIDIYKAAVASQLTYGCEEWNITPEIVVKLNGTNVW